MFRRLILIKVQRQRCFNESASRSTRASHTQHTHYTHARRTLRTRAHTFSFYSISIFSLSLIHTLSGFTSHRGRKRERFFSLSRVYVLHSLSLCRAFLRKPFTPKHARVIVPMRCSLIRMSAWSFLALFLSTCSSSSSD